MRIDPRGILRLPWPTLAIGLVVFALSGACVFVVLGGTRAAELLATPARAPAALKIELASSTTSADLTAIQAQPLLYASRVFYLAPAVDATPAAPPRPDYRLAGTFLVPGKPAVALLANSQSGANRRVKPGETLDGWTVEAVSRKQVTFLWQDQRFELSTTPPPVSAGLKRVPVTRARVASSDGGTGVQALGAVGGTSPAFSGGAPSDQPRLYRPPPN